MRELGARVGVAVMVVGMVLVALAILTAARLLDPTVHLALYLLANVLFVVDFADFAVRIGSFYRTNPGSPWIANVPTSIPLEAPETRLAEEGTRPIVRPYALVVSVFQAADDLDDFVDAMEPLRERLWMIDDGSGDDTRLRLVQAGFRCLDGGRNRKKPGALRELLRTLPTDVESVLVLDPDTVPRVEDPAAMLESVLVDFQRSGMASLTPHFTVREDGLVVRFQALEYAVACSLGRKTLGDVATNSGVSIYRRDALERALAGHSLSVYAEDLEISLSLLASGERIYYDERLSLESEAKRTWRGLWSQRVGWSYGLLRVYAQRFGDVRRTARRSWLAAYHYLVSVVVFQLLLHPARIAALLLLGISLANGLDDLLGFGAIPDNRFTAPAYFVAFYLKYSLLMLMTLTMLPRSQRRDHVSMTPFYLFYQLFLVLAMTVGYANWISLRLGGRRLYRDHYQDEESLRRTDHGR